MPSKTHHTSLFLPLLLIFTGGVFLLSSLKIVPESGWNLFFRLWPVILIVAGLDELFRGKSFVGPIVAAGLGTILLLSNLNILMTSALGMIAQFWPALIIAWGLDLIIGHRSRIAALVGVVVGLGLIGGIFYLAVMAPASALGLQSIPVSQRLEDIRQAEVEIGVTAGTLSLNASSDPAMLLEGSINHLSNETIDQDYTTRSGTGTLSIKSRGVVAIMPFSPSYRQATWKLNVTPNLPLEVQTKLVMGDQRLDLSQLTRMNLNAETVIGMNLVTLPRDGDRQISLKGVIGETRVLVPRGTAVNVQVNTALTTLSFPSDWQRTGNQITSPTALSSSKRISLDVEQTIGSLSIQYFNE